MTVRRLGEARDKAQPRIQQQGIAAAQVRQQSDTAAVLEATALSAEQIGSINDQLVTINQRIDGLEQNEP
jgi:thiamine monophosphate synthase